MTAATGPMGIPLTGHELGGNLSTASTAASGWWSVLPTASGRGLLEVTITATSAATTLGAPAATSGLLFADEDRF